MGARFAICTALFLLLADILALHCIAKSRAQTAANRIPMYTRTCKFLAADFLKTIPAIHSETPMRMPIVNIS